MEPKQIFFVTNQHEHPLKAAPAGDVWLCNGRNLEAGCYTEKNTYDGAPESKRFRCDLCDYDLCIKCLSIYAEKVSTNSDGSASTQTSVHNHRVTLSDTGCGWSCNGEECPHPNETSLLEKWRCAECDYDLCRSCLEKSHTGLIEGGDFTKSALTRMH